MDKFHLNKDFYLTLLDNVSDGVYFVSPERRILFWNKTAELISGYSAQEVIGRYCHDNILDHVDPQGHHLCTSACPLHLTLTDGKSRHAQIFLHHKKGHRVSITISTKAIRDKSGKIIGAVETFQETSDIQRLNHRARQLAQAAYIDALTRIGNRRYLERNLQLAINDYQQAGVPFGVIMFDIDLFKRINDTLGHNIGDQVLIMVANTLHKNLRQGDTLARWGGEEFVAIVVGTNQNGLRATSEKLRILVAESHVQLEKVEISVTVSAGATMAKLQDNKESLIKRADTLLYASKREGRNRVTLG